MRMVSLEGLHISYTSMHGDNRMQISGYRFEGMSHVKAHNKEAGEGRIFTLRCKCKSTDWSDNGRHMHEYECNCCGQFVEAYAKD